MLTFYSNLYMPKRKQDVLTVEAKKANEKSYKKSKVGDTTLSNYDSDELYRTYGGGSHLGGIGGGYTPIKADISGLLRAYDDQANSARNIAKTTYDTTRSDLLTSLKRFQEQNARDTMIQRQAYLSDQASLEAAREQANRQNRISSSARGLGGSGLQQLAQMQNLIGQSEEISKLANKNQGIMDNLRNLLKQKTEDTDTGINKATRTYNDVLGNIASQLANQKAQAIAENEANYANAVNQARAQAAAARASASNLDAEARGQADSINALFNAQMSTFQRGLIDINNATSSSKLKSVAEKLGLNYEKGATKKSIAKQLTTKFNTTFADPNEGLYAQYATPDSYRTNTESNINKLLSAYGFNKYYNR